MFRIKTESRTRRDYWPVSLTLWSAGFKKAERSAYTSCNRLRSSPLSCIATEHELNSGKIGAQSCLYPVTWRRPPKRHWRVQKIDLTERLQFIRNLQADKTCGKETDVTLTK